jgi:hypothetical protein
MTNIPKTRETYETIRVGIPSRRAIGLILPVRKFLLQRGTACPLRVPRLKVGNIRASGDGSGTPAAMHESPIGPAPAHRLEPGLRGS